MIIVYSYLANYNTRTALGQVCRLFIILNTVFKCEGLQFLTWCSVKSCVRLGAFFSLQWVVTSFPMFTLHKHINSYLNYSSFRARYLKRRYTLASSEDCSFIIHTCRYDSDTFAGHIVYDECTSPLFAMSIFSDKEIITHNLDNDIIIDCTFIVWPWSESSCKAACIYFSKSSCLLRVLWLHTEYPLRYTDNRLWWLMLPWSMTLFE